MRYNLGYFEEKKLGKAYDRKLLKRLFPFTQPYRVMLGVSIALVIVITLLDLALPYITKVAIDRYIVPVMDMGSDAAASEAATAQNRHIRIEQDNPDVAAIVRKHPQAFISHGDERLLPFENLGELPAEDLKVLRRADLQGLGLVACVFLLAVILNFVLNFFQKVIMEYTGHMIMHDLRMKLYNHLQQLPMRFYTRNPVGRLVTRVTSDVQNMHELFTSVIALIFKDLFLFVGITIVLISMHWPLALVTFSVVPLILLAALRFSRQVREAFRAERIKVAEINTRFGETINGIKIIQAFRKERANYKRFKALNHENYLVGMQQIHVLALFLPVVDFLGVLALAIVIYYGGGNALAGSISLGVLVAFISYMRMFFRPIRDLAEKYNILQNAMASAERLFIILDTEQEPGRQTAPSLIDKSTNHSIGFEFEKLEFDKVSFAYPEGEPVLKEVSFRLKRGQTIAVVGPTGSGKTTLINLIMRFYDPNTGAIKVNGQDIRSLDVAALRSSLALVMQEPFLFSESIRDNILRGNANLSDQALDQIIEASRCAALVKRLPDGIDTVLGESGGSISSGERQLLSIARAFAKDPQLLILDEATSYIDTQTENEIQSALSTLMRQRTALVVAHRLSTARQADQIMVVNRGRIIEKGTHAELMARAGFYFRLNQVEG